MNKSYSRLAWFCAGVIVGVACTFLYQIGGRPAMPKVEKCDVTYLYDMREAELFDVLDAIREQMNDIRT